MTLGGRWREHRDRFLHWAPGTRFQEEYRASHDRHAPRWRRPARILLGIAVIVVGLVALPAPGPGTLIVALGLALLARESAWLARALDRLEVRVRGWVAR